MIQQVKDKVSGSNDHAEGKPADYSDREVLVEVESVSKKFAKSLKKSLFYGIKDIGTELLGRSVRPELRSDEFWALRDINFTVRRGEALGIIGKNGAGKSTLLKILTGLIKPTTGQVKMKGKVQALIELGSGMSPILTGRENIYINAAVMGIPKEEVEAKFDDIVEFAELGEFIDMPFQNYSSGMKVRLGFAIAIHVKPDILIIDEVLAVGDKNFRYKARRAMAELLARNVALIFISHNISEVQAITETAMCLERGEIQMLGDTPTVCLHYINLGKKSDSANKFEYLPNRTGLIELSNSKVINQKTVISECGRSVNLNKGENYKFTFSAVVKANVRICEEVYHELVLWNANDYVQNAFICIKDFIDFDYGEEKQYQFEVDTLKILPGKYRLGYAIKDLNDSPLEGVRDLFYLNVDFDDVEKALAYNDVMKIKMYRTTFANILLDAKIHK